MAPSANGIPVPVGTIQNDAIQSLHCCSSLCFGAASPSQGHYTGSNPVGSAMKSWCQRQSKSRPPLVVSAKVKLDHPPGSFRRLWREGREPVAPKPGGEEPMTPS